VRSQEPPVSTQRSPPKDRLIARLRLASRGFPYHSHATTDTNAHDSAEHAVSSPDGTGTTTAPSPSSNTGLRTPRTALTLPNEYENDGDDDDGNDGRLLSFFVDNMSLIMREASRFTCPSGQVRTVASIKIRVVLERGYDGCRGVERFGDRLKALAQVVGFGFQET
jgi:hypothetical protein